MTDNIKDIAKRIKELRDICDISVEDIAREVEMGVDKYLEYESGNKDLPIGFLCKVANRFGVDVIELLTGSNPKLNMFAYTKHDKGLEVSRFPQYHYQSLAYTFKHKKIEPFLVTMDPSADPVVLNAHTGHEFDYLISGNITMYIEGHKIEMSPGDSIYLDSSYMHGFSVTGPEPAKFLAIVLDKDD